VWSTFAQFNIVLIQYRFEGQGLSLQIYTNEEKLTLITTYSEWRRNAATAWQLYSERYPDQNILLVHTIDDICQMFLGTGIWNTTNHCCSKPVMYEANEVAGLACTPTNPHICIRQISHGSGINCSNVIQILHCNKYHPYHLSLLQKLHGNDFNIHVEFGEFPIHQLQNKNNLFQNVLFTYKFLLQTMDKLI
jgi:hypothetical protein